MAHGFDFEAGEARTDGGEHRRDRWFANEAPVIGGSVGLGGMNRRVDVIAVQTLLEGARVSPGPPDGRCGRRTISAIERFQRDVLRRPDGRIDVNGPTLRRLRDAARKPDLRAHASASKDDRRTPAAVAPPLRPVQSRPAAGSRPQVPPDRPASELPNSFWKGHTALPSPEINRGLTSPTSAQLTELLGDPTSERFVARVATEMVGPFRATGLKPALASLRSVLTQIHHDLPDLYGLLGNNGMRVVRKARGRSTYSLHSWGVALDFLIAGEAPPLGTTHSFRGLDALAPYFNRAGWYWGGGYRNVTRKDPMHFECGLALVRSFGL